MTKTNGRQKGNSRTRHPDFNFNVDYEAMAKQKKEHILLGYVPGTMRMVKDKDGKEFPTGVPIFQYVGYEIGKKYTGPMLRELRKKNGVGRKPKTEQTVSQTS